MSDRSKFFDRPSPAEEREARLAMKHRKEEDARIRKVVKAHEKRQAEIKARLAENDPTPWWRRG
jgi:hypothetical protein